MAEFISLKNILKREVHVVGTSADTVPTINKKKETLFLEIVNKDFCSVFNCWRRP